jgi:uncharacterized membrane protein
VLVAMLSNHYGWLHEGRYNWLVLSALMLAGALIRHSFVARHKARVEGRRVPWEYAAAGSALLVGLVVGMAPAPQAGTAATAATATLAEVTAVIERRCLACHNAQVQNKGVALHTPALIRQHAQQMYQQVVVLRAMPLNNATQITPAERELVKRWFEAGVAAR